MYCTISTSAGEALLAFAFRKDGILVGENVEVRLGDESVGLSLVPITLDQPGMPLPDDYGEYLVEALSDALTFASDHEQGISVVPVDKTSLTPEIRGGQVVACAVSDGQVTGFAAIFPRYGMVVSRRTENVDLLDLRFRFDPSREDVE